MPSSSGFVQAYNAQAAVDTDTHLIVENHITQQPNDKQEVEPALEALQAAAKQLGKAQGLLADTGYFSEDNVKRCEAQETTPYICDRRERHNQPLEEKLKPVSPCGVDADVLTRLRYRPEYSRGQGDICQAQINGRDGIRHNQRGYGIPTISSPRA